MREALFFDKNNNGETKSAGLRKEKTLQQYHSEQNHIRRKIPREFSSLMVMVMMAMMMVVMVMVAMMMVVMMMMMRPAVESVEVLAIFYESPRDVHCVRSTPS